HRAVPGTLGALHGFTVHQCATTGCILGRATRASPERSHDQYRSCASGPTPASGRGTGIAHSPRQANTAGPGKFPLEFMDAVITRLMGGLGNQLVQYAAGYALATRLGVPLLLDRSFLDSRPPHMDWTARPFELNAYQIDPAFADADLVARIMRRSGSRWGHLLPHRSFTRWQHFREKDKQFDSGFDGLDAPVLIDGFWQNERYFL